MGEIELSFNKESFEELLKYQGDPPCYTCLARATCFNATLNRYSTYDIKLNDSCPEGEQWISIVDHLYYFTDTYLSLPDGLLGIEEIKKIIQLGENENIENLARKFYVRGSAMKDFKEMVDELFELLDYFYEDEVMQEFIEPFVEDQIQKLKEKEKISSC